jgi:hypothetical protein
MGVWRPRELFSGIDGRKRLTPSRQDPANVFVDAGKNGYFYKDFIRKGFWAIY